MARRFRDHFSAIHIAALAFCLTRRTAKSVFLQGEPPTHFFHRSRCSQKRIKYSRLCNEKRSLFQGETKRGMRCQSIFWKKYVPNLLTRKTPKIKRNSPQLNFLKKYVTDLLTKLRQISNAFQADNCRFHPFKARRTKCAKLATHQVTVGKTRDAKKRITSSFTCT